MSQNTGSLLLPPASLEELDVSPGIVIDIMLRLLFTEGDTSATRFEEVLRLPFKVLDEILVHLQQEHLIEVMRSTGRLGRRSYLYSITDEGKVRARDALERSQYIGPAPVPLEKYNKAIMWQANREKVNPERVKEALSHLILPAGFHRHIGPALNSGTSLFLYGPPGNGKTTIAQAMAMLVAGSDTIWLPYAITVGGQYIQIYDQMVHREVTTDDEQEATVDPRWRQYRRPVVIAGGELKLESLDLRFDPVAKFYEAPLQMRANGGMLLIDDFGRQQMRPTDLLNRWIVPLETQIDLFRLQTGQTFQMPFKQMIVFATNLNPEELVDDAFLRRIQVKVEVTRPDEKLFYRLFATMCQQYNVPFDKDTFVYLLREWYHNTGREFQAVHPRDILRGVAALCEYEAIPNQLNPELIDEACRNYFVRPQTADAKGTAPDKW